LGADRLRRLRSDIPPRRPGAARGDHQATALLVAQDTQRLLDQWPLVRDDPRDRLPRTRQDLRQAVSDGWAAAVLVDATAGAIGDGDDPKADGRVGAHGWCSLGSPLSYNGPRGHHEAFLEEF